MPWYIDQFNECTDPVAGDMLWLVDASAPTGDKDRRLDINRLAILARAQTFTKTQTIQPDSSSVNGLVVNMPSGTTADGVVAQYNGATRVRLVARETSGQMRLEPFDGGAGSGPHYTAGRNNNASTPTPGSYLCEQADGAGFRSIYPDNSGIWRTLFGAPLNSNFASGTVIGAQTSMAAAKYLQDSLSAIDEVLARIEMGANAVRRFTYRDGRFGGQEFEGVVTDYAPEYGMDRTEEHPEGQALNEIQVIGDLLRAVAWLKGQVEALQTEIAQLKGVR